MAQNGLLQPAISSMDTDFFVVDFDAVDDGTEVSAAGLDGALFEILAHELDEGGDLLFRDPSLW